MEETRKGWWRWGVNRWIILALIIIGAVLVGQYAPIRPHIQLPAEAVTGELFNFAGQPFKITNTIVATVLADIILIIIALLVFRGVKKAVKSGTMVVTGIAGAIEALVEGLYSMTESTAGKWAKSIFPFFATITLLVLVVNWMELFPGVESVGLIEHPHGEDVHGFDREEAELFGFINFGVDTIVEPEEGHHGEWAIVPFIRVASTDLNFTMALALVSVVFTQVIGFRALGFGYLKKFFYTDTLFKVPIFGVIDFGVGLLELLSDFIKIVAFTFRLFGNIFAGSVILFVIGSLVPVFAQVPFLMLEFFVGLIQAIVFGLLTMTFMSMATVSHHGDEAH